MLTMLDLLEEGARPDRFLRTIPGPSDPPSLSTVWSWSERTARFLRHRVGPAGTVGILLTNSAECLAALFGGWRAGLRVASLPLPARAMPLPEYFAQLRTIISTLDMGLVVMDDELAAGLSDLPISIATYTSALEGGPAAPVHEIGSFVQFTSGSTSMPKGISLTLKALAANALAIKERMGAPEPAIGCSWLPLSHDMGLVGMCLTIWSLQRDASAGGIVLLRPDRFLAQPDSWLAACSEFRASITATPTFGLDLALRRASSLGEASLTDLKICIVGSEPVRAGTLRKFAEGLSPRGFAPTALAPAYGLAEASLAVSINPTHEPWTSTTVDARALEEGRWDQREPGEGSVELVSLGRPLDGMSVTTDNVRPGRLGQLKVRGTSMFSGYVGAPQPSMPDGWFSTSDMGYITDGQLYVTGRADEVLLVGGRNFFPQDLELAAATTDGVRQHSTAAISFAGGGYTMVVECPPGEPDSAELKRLCRRVRVAVARRAGIGPVSVIVIPRGSFPRTSSGKHQRKRLAAQLADNRISTLVETHFR